MFIKIDNKIKKIIWYVFSLNSIILWVKRASCHIAPDKISGVMRFLNPKLICGIKEIKMLKI